MAGKLLCTDCLLLVSIQQVWGGTGPSSQGICVAAQLSLPLFPGRHCAAGLCRSRIRGPLSPWCVCSEVMAALRHAGHGHEVSPLTFCVDRW